MRSIRDIAAIFIIGALLKSLLSTLLIYFYNIYGIAIYLVMLVVGQYLVTFYFVRKIEVNSAKLESILGKLQKHVKPWFIIYGRVSNNLRNRVSYPS